MKFTKEVRVSFLTNYFSFPVLPSNIIFIFLHETIALCNRIYQTLVCGSPAEAPGAEIQSFTLLCKRGNR